MVGEGGSFQLNYSQPDWAYSGRAMVSYAYTAIKGSKSLIRPQGAIRGAIRAYKWRIKGSKGL